MIPKGKKKNKFYKCKRKPQNCGVCGCVWACVKITDNRKKREWKKVKKDFFCLHLEPRKEFLLQDPVADWLVTVSASVGVAGAEPPKARPPALTLTGVPEDDMGSSAFSESPPPFDRPLPLPARTHRHAHKSQQRERERKKNMPGSVSENLSAKSAINTLCTSQICSPL